MFSENTLKINWQMLQTCLSWLEEPTSLTFTADEYLGDAAEELSSWEPAGELATRCDSTVPEIEPEEFESVYRWYLA